MLKKNLDLQIVAKCKTDFHKQVLSSWITIHSTEPKSYKEITNQFLLYNKSLKIIASYQHFLKVKTQEIYQILNLLSPQDTFVNIVEFNEYNQTNITVLNTTH